MAAAAASSEEVVKGAKVLMVGAGGIGCELLKTLALSGFSDIHIQMKDETQETNQTLGHKVEVEDMKPNAHSKEVFSPTQEENDANGESELNEAKRRTRYADQPDKVKAKRNAKRRDDYQRKKVEKESTINTSQQNTEPEKFTYEKCTLPRDAPLVGCSCSKASSCKTNKCECKVSGVLCRLGCGCKDSKCSNRYSSSAAEREKSTNEKCILPRDAPPDGCSCSKASSCKTNKCECRGSGASCCPGCGCKDSKCSNRDFCTHNSEIVSEAIMVISNSDMNVQATSMASRPCGEVVTSSSSRATPPTCSLAAP